MGDENCRDSQSLHNVDGHWVDDCVIQLAIDFSVLRPSQNYPFNKKIHTVMGIFSSVWGSFDAIHSDGRVITIGGLGQIALADNYGGFDMNLRGSFG